jgi:predicted extracellular nuclease
MLKHSLNKAIYLVLFLVFLVNFTFSQENGNKSVRIMFYNVENLFDIQNDSLKNDEEFLPDGLRRWNNTRYYKKLNSIFRTIASAGEWSPPEIIGLAEIENRKVLEDLIHNTYLSKYSYGIVHEDSPDLRGIDVGMIFRNDLITVLDHRSFIPEHYTKDNFFSRNVLYVKCIIRNDTVHIFINHWPSKLGGTLANIALRIDIAEMVKNKADSINLRSKGKARIVVMGDFNCTWSDNEMKILVSEEVETPEQNIGLINLSENPAKKGKGSYRYQGIWEMFDQIIVSDYLINCKYGLCTDTESFNVYDPDFLLKNDSKYPGRTPFSTFLGYRYQGGYSDHLPVILRLRMK